MQNRLLMMTLGILALAMTGCSDNQSDAGNESGISGLINTPASQTSTGDTAPLRQYSEQREPCSDFTPERNPLFGELHVHTSLSFDAAAARTKTLPADAYRFAKGEAIPFFPLDANGNVTGEITIDRPLDFAAVTDHGEFLGETAMCKEPGSPAYNGAFCIEYRKVEFRGAAMIATSNSGDFPNRISLLCGEDGKLCRDYAAGPWQIIMALPQNLWVDKCQKYS